MYSLPSKLRAILLTTFVLGSALAHAQPMQILGQGTTGPAGWDLTVSARLDPLGATGTVALVGGLFGEVLSIQPPSNDPSGCWCINARRMDVDPGRVERVNVYIRDVGDGLGSFDQFTLVSGGAIDCSFPMSDVPLIFVRKGDFKAFQEDNTPPSTSLIAPADGMAFPHGSSIQLSAQATSSGASVSYLDFFSDSLHIGRAVRSSITNLYTFTWHPPRDGHFVLHAVAVDDKGGRGFSTSSRIYVGDGNPGVFELGTVEVRSIGHAIFDPNSDPFREPLPKAVLNFLVQQDQSSGGGALLPLRSINWDTNSQFALTISAPAGHKFHVQVPPGRAVGFDGLLWWESTRGGTSPHGTATVTFSGLEGTPPEFMGTVALLSESHGFFGWGGLGSTMVSNNFAFTSITLTGTAIPQRTGAGTEHYVPNIGCSFHLYYTTFETNHVQPFVSLVPLLTPAEQIVALIQQFSTNSNPSKVKRPLLTLLRLCGEAMDRGDTKKARQLLTAFQHKVAAQIGNADPAYAQELMTAVQAVIDSLPSS